MPKRSRKEIARFGRRGDLVRVVEDRHRGAPVYRVLFKKADGNPSAVLYPRTRAGRSEALAFAEGFREERDRGAPAPAPPITTRELFERYMASEDESHRPATTRNYIDRWKYWETFVGPETHAEALGYQSMQGLRDALEARGLAVNTIRKTFSLIRTVYRWGVLSETIRESKVDLYQYRVAKDKQPVSPDEFTGEEFLALMESMPLDHGQFWRGHVTLGLCGLQGARQWAVLHLQWDDIDLDQRVIIWRARWDKGGVEWIQPLREPSITLLAIARYWRKQLGYEGPWILFPGNVRSKQEVYTRGALSWALKSAEKRAGIEHKRGRGAHGLRRMLSGDVHELTNSVKDALDAIGDRDMKMARRYIKPRLERMRATFDRLDEQFENNLKTPVDLLDQEGSK